MAGDWIKVEQATGEKPEVLTMARMLGVSRREVIGILFDYWSWLDRNACHEVVRNLSRQCLDDVLHCPGFAACLEHVGWVEWDDEGGSATIVNYDRHNGSSAKTRASDQKRKREERGQNPDKNRTREEKRRVTTEREMPTPEHREIAKALAIDIDVEWLKYQDHQKNAKNKHSDLVAGFRNWLRRANEFKPPPLRAVAGGMTAAERRADTADQMFRRGKYAVNDSSERDISSVAERLD